MNSYDINRCDYKKKDHVTFEYKNEDIFLSKYDLFNLPF